MEYDENKFLCCPKCNNINKSDIHYCSKCGYNLNYIDSLGNRINKKVNVFAVFVGLLGSILGALIAIYLFSPSFIGNQITFFMYLFVILVFMSFTGSLVASLIGSYEYDESIVNSSMILTFFIVNFSLIGLYMYITALGVASVLKSIFGGSNYSTDTTAVANSTATSTDPGFLLTPLAMLFMVIAMAYIGGFIGTFVKKMISNR